MGRLQPLHIRANNRCCLVLILAVGEGVKCYLVVVLIYVSLRTDDAGHLFMDLLISRSSSLDKGLVRTLACFCISIIELQVFLM